MFRALGRFGGSMLGVVTLAMGFSGCGWLGYDLHRVVDAGAGAGLDGSASDAGQDAAGRLDSSGGGSVDASGQAVSIAGMWAGVWHSDPNGVDSPISQITFVQNGSVITGNAGMPNSTCVDTATLMGDSNGARLLLSGAAPNFAVDLDLRLVNANVLRGSYSITTGACAGDFGTLTLTRE